MPTAVITLAAATSVSPTTLARISWVSVNTEDKTKLLLFAADEKGKVFGYYPYTDDANVLGIGDATTIPVKILNMGNIIVGDDEGQGTLDGVDSKKPTLPKTRSTSSTTRATTS